MRKQLLVCILGLVGLSAHAETARVLSSNPVFETGYSQQQVCDQVQNNGYGHQVNQPQQQAGIGGVGMGTIIGGVAGALLGNQVGGGNGKVAATAIGAVVGSQVGQNMQGQGSSPGYGNGNGGNNQPSCRYINQPVQNIVGYDVEFELNGGIFRKRLPFQPGQYLNVEISVLR